LAEVFCRVLDYKDRYVIRDYPNFYPKDEPLRRCPNIDKVVRDTGIQPKTTLEVGLKQMLNYFKENEL
jgi:UDP-glucuronate decarboxylase